MAEGSADEGTVDGHLGYSRADVVAVLAAIVGDPRGQDLLQTRQGTRGEHLGPQRVALKLLKVGLGRSTCQLNARPEWFLWGANATYRQITASSVSSSQLLANLVRQTLMLVSGDGSRANGFLLELDRHGDDDDEETTESASIW